MYGLTSQSGYIHSFVYSDSSYNWQQNAPYDASAGYNSEAQQPWSAPPTGSAHSTTWNYAESTQANGYCYQALQPAKENACSLPQFATNSYSGNCFSGWNSAGRPPHPVVAFGFGGTLTVIKSPTQQLYNQAPQCSSSIEVHSLNSLIQPAAGLDFHGLEGKSKSELFKWIDDRISNCAYEEAGNKKAEALPLVWGALKIAYEHHGKLRSSGGLQSEVNGGPEAAMGQLILSASSSVSTQGCLQQVPNSDSLQATSIKVKGLLLSGKTQQALECAQEGQAWGLALVLASQLGEKCYSDTVSKMANHQSGPLRTFSLLMGGQSAEVFDELSNNAPSAQQGSILDNWHEHLALMATNRTFGDEGVITRLGDSLWSLKEEVAAAHLCYLLIDQNPHAYFTDGRIRLIGADHWKNSRTFITPLAIKRTEIYECVKAKSNPQFVLTCLQPYKLVYATMLAEAGQQEEALRYCRSVLKALKAVSSSHNVELCKQAAAELESRLLQSLQDAKGGYGRFAGRILTNTFSYVMSSLPATKITRYNSSASIPSVELDQSNNNKFAARSVSEPDLSKHVDENSPKPPNPGFLRRVGSNMLQRTATLVSKKQTTPNDNFQFQGAYIEQNEQNSATFLNENGYPPQESKAGKAGGLYVQCSDYYSRYMTSFSKDGSQLMKSLISPQLPPILKIGSRKPQAQRVEV